MWSAGYPQIQRRCAGRTSPMLRGGGGRPHREAPPAEEEPADSPDDEERRQRRQQLEELLARQRAAEDEGAALEARLQRWRDEERVAPGPPRPMCGRDGAGVCRRSLSADATWADTGRHRLEPVPKLTPDVGPRVRPKDHGRSQIYISQHIWPACRPGIDLIRPDHGPKAARVGPSSARDAGLCPHRTNSGGSHIQIGGSQVDGQVGGQLRSTSPRFGRLRPASVDMPPRSGEEPGHIPTHRPKGPNPISTWFGFVPRSVGLGHNTPGVDQRPGLGRAGHRLKQHRVEFHPNSPNSWPMSTDLSPTLANFGHVWLGVDQM